MHKRPAVRRLNPLLRLNATTVRGDGRGRTIGYPTINLSLDDIPPELTHGIYACWAVIGGASYTAAMHYGPRPVFDADTALEVYLIDASLDTLPSRVSLEVVAKLRDVQDFNNADELKKAIAEDVSQTRDILSSA